MSVFQYIDSTIVTSNIDSVTFSNIPSNYVDIVGTITFAQSTASYGVAVRFNNDATGLYSATLLYGNGTTVNTGRTSSATYAYVSEWGVTSSTTIAIPAMSKFELFNYSNSSINKSFIATAAGSGTSNGVDMHVGLWRNTTAISSITFLAAPTGNLVSGTTITLFGVR